MKVEKNSVNEIFISDHQFSVPLFQRKYVWTIDNWKLLWDDIMYTYEKDILSTSNPKTINPFYFGTCYLQKKDETNTWLIIDGQQRFLTLSIFFSAIRDLLPDIESVVNHYIFLQNNSERIHNDKNIRINPSEWDKKTYFQIIENTTRDRSLFSDAYEYYKNELNQLNSSQIKSILYILLYRVEFIVIRLNQDEDAFSTFEAVNGRGKQLSESDLVRNEFLRKFLSFEDTLEYYNSFWLPMERLLNLNL